MTRSTTRLRVGIRAFQGIVLEDSWVHFNKDYLFHPNCPTALIVGSALEFDGAPRKLAKREHLESFCFDIGQLLAVEGFHLINGACPGLPDTAMAAFSSSSRNTVSVGLSAYDSPRTHTAPKDFAPNGFPLSADVTVFCGTGFELLNVLNTLCADVLIVVGGGVGALLEAAAAVEQELPVLCLEPAGGISEDLHALLSKYIASFKNFDVRLCQDIADIRQNLCGIREKFVRASLQSRLTPLIRDIERAEQARDSHVLFEISPDVTAIKYSYRGSSVELLDPILMTDRVRLSRTPIKGEQILAALETRPRIYIFQRVEVAISQSVSSAIWGPNIDTLLMLKSILSLQLHLSGKSVLEIGFGSGLISLWLSTQGCKVVGIEADPASVLCADWNCSNQGLGSECDFRLETFGDAFDDTYDLIVCTPPYLPPISVHHRRSLAYSGCELLNAVCENYEHSLSKGGICLITVSSASFLDERFRANFERLSARGSLRVVHKARVPMKVYDVLDDEAWLKFLHSRGGIFQGEGQDYTWWHDVMVIELSN